MWTRETEAEDSRKVIVGAAGNGDIWGEKGGDGARVWAGHRLTTFLEVAGADGRREKCFLTADVSPNPPLPERAWGKQPWGGSGHTAASLRAKRATGHSEKRPRIGGIFW